MKKFWAIFSMILMLALTVAPAEAKRFGGGKSFGQARHTAPAKQTPQKKDTAPAADKAGAQAGKKGMAGGMLGGLLAGGLLGYLLGNGAFEGLQFMDMLIFGLIAFVIFKLLRSRAGAVTNPNARPAFDTPSTSQNQQRTSFNENNSGSVREPMFNQIGGGFAAPQVPLNLPEGFDLTAFLIGARDHYRTLQKAWNTNDFSIISEYVTPALQQELQAERNSYTGDQHTEVLFVDAELVHADHDSRYAEVSLKFTGRYRDSHEGVEEDIHDIWHLQRDLEEAGAPWVIIGIES